MLSLAAAPDGTSVFVGGKFTTANGAPAGGIVKLDAATGATVPGFTMSTNGWVQDMKVNGSRLFLSGTFSTMKATSRTGFGAVNATTGSIDANVAPVFSDPISNTLQVQKFDVTPDGSRAVALGHVLQGRQPAAAVPGGARPDHHSGIRRPMEPAAHPGHVSPDRELPAGGRHLP